MRESNTPSNNNNDHHTITGLEQRIARSMFGWVAAGGPVFCCFIATLLDFSVVCNP
jgi:hypothetical protein